MHVGGSARLVLRVGSLLLVGAALAGVWELLASQAPGSPLYIGMLPAPIERLRTDAERFGMLLWLAGLALGDRALPRRMGALLGSGSLLVLASGAYAAMTGMNGVQLHDLRADAVWVFLGKQLGRALLLTGLAMIGWRVLGPTRDPRESVR
jgi:hypothetical protein